MNTIQDITRDPQGYYIGRDGAFNLYWFSVNLRCWVYLDPENYGTVLQ